MSAAKGVGWGHNQSGVRMGQEVMTSCHTVTVTHTQKSRQNNVFKEFNSFILHGLIAKSSTARNRTSDLRVMNPTRYPLRYRADATEKCSNQCFCLL